MPRVNVTLTAEELAHVDATRGRHSRSSRVAEIVAASRDVLGAGEKLRSAGLLTARGVEASVSDVIDEVTRLRHGRTEAIKALGLGNEVFDRDGLDVAESIRQLRRRLDGDVQGTRRDGTLVVERLPDLGLAIEQGDAVLDGVRLPSRSRP